MNNIHLFSKISAIFVAFILVTTPIASALASGYALNEETPPDAADYGGVKDIVLSKNKSHLHILAWG